MFNLVVLQGNLTRDPEIKSLPSGTQVAEFGLAVNESYTNKAGEKVKQTMFVDCQAWGKQVDFIGNFANKGDAVLISGSLKLESWEKDGAKRSKHSVRVEKFNKLSKRKEDDAQTEPDNVPELAAVGGEDIPF